MERQGQTLWILWGALLASCAMFGGLMIFVAPEAAKTADPEALAILTPVIAALAIVVLAFSLFAGPLLARSVGHLVPYAIVGWALAESAATMGLVLAFLGLAPGTALLFVAGSMLAIVLQAPGEGFRERFTKYRAGR